MNCIFVSDIHGKKEHFEKIFKIVAEEKPDAVFLGGDILPNQFSIEGSVEEFIESVIFKPIKKIDCASFFVILGNDDPRIYEKQFIEADEQNILNYVNEKTVKFDDLFVTGYSYVPPTPFQLKDWERYDVSRFVDVGAISPEEGMRTVDVGSDEIRYSTISADLKKLSKNAPIDKTIFLFHSPPYNSNLDRAALDGESYDHAPLDVHIGSIAIQRFIEKSQPFLTLHGHVHESYSLTKIWKEKTGKTLSFQAANHNSDLAIIRFDTDDLEKATRDLVKV